MKVKDDGLLESEENGDEGLFLGEDDITGNTTTGGGGKKMTNREGYPLAERIQSFSDERRTKDLERLKEGIGPRSASTSDLSTVERKNISPSRLRSESVSISNRHREPVEPLRQRSMSVSGEFFFDPFAPSSCPAQTTGSYNPFTENYEDEGYGTSVRIDFNLNEVVQDQGEEKQEGDYDETTCLSGRGGEKSKSKGRRKKRGKERGDEKEEQDEPEEEETPRRRKSFPFRRASKPITPRKDAELLVRSAEVQLQQRSPRTHHTEDCEFMNDDVCFESHVNDKKHKSKVKLTYHYAAHC